MSEKGKINPFIKSSLIYTIATIFGQGMTFISIIVFTRLMRQEDYGNYSTYYAYVSLFIVFIGANLYVPLNNAYIDKKETIHQFRKSVLFLSLMIMLGVTFLALLVGCIILKQFSSLVIVFAALHSYAFFNINYRIYSANMENDYKKKQWLLIIPNLLQFLVALAFVLLMRNNTYQARIMGSTLGLFSVAAVCFIEIMQCRGPLIDLESWKYALSISLPSMVMSLSFMLMQHCDKVMITNICGPEETAVYSVIYYLGYAIIAVDQAIAPVRQAWIYKKLGSNDTTGVKTLQKWYLVIMALLSTGLLLIGPIVVMIIAPHSYWRFEYILPFVLSACMMMIYRFHTEVMTFYKRNMTLSMCVLVSALVNIGLNALLIPKFGAVAACYTTVISYFLLFVMTMRISQRLCDGLYSSKYFTCFFIWIVIMSLINTFFYEETIMRSVLYVLACLFIFWYCIRKKDECREIIWMTKIPDAH